MGLCAQDNGYLALYSQHPTRWLTDRHDTAAPVNELRVEAVDYIWLVEMGDVERWGSFENFVEAIASAQVEVNGLELSFDSPSIGNVQFSWQGDLRVKEEQVELHNYPRFDNPYCQVEFGSKQVEVEYAGQKAEIVFE